MAIRIVKIHPADEPEALNTEWFVVENRGDKPFSTRNCTVAVTRRGSKKRIALGTLDPGFTLLPGAKTRVVTGNPGKKAHGHPPQDEVPNYNLFLNTPVLRGKGTILIFSLRSHSLDSAEFDPDSADGVAPAA